MMMKDGVELFVPLADEIRKRKREAMESDKMTRQEQREAEFITWELGERAGLGKRLCLRRKRAAVYGPRLFKWMRDNKLQFVEEGRDLIIWIDEAEENPQTPPGKRKKTAAPETVVRMMPEQRSIGWRRRLPVPIICRMAPKENVTVSF